MRCSGHSCTGSDIDVLFPDLDDKNEPKLLQNLTSDPNTVQNMDANEDDRNLADLPNNNEDNLVDLGQNRPTHQNISTGRHSRQGSDVPLINPGGGHSRQSSDVSLRAYNIANALGRTGHSRQNSDSLIAGRINRLQVELNALANRGQNDPPFPSLDANPTPGHVRQSSDTSRITLGHSRQGSDVPLIGAHPSGGHSRQSSDVSILGGHFPPGGHSRQSSDVPLLDINQAGQPVQEELNASKLNICSSSCSIPTSIVSFKSGWSALNHIRFITCMQ